MKFWLATVILSIALLVAAAASRDHDATLGLAFAAGGLFSFSGQLRRTARKVRAS